MKLTQSELLTAITLNQKLIQTHFELSTLEEYEDNISCSIDRILDYCGVNITLMCRVNLDKDEKGLIYCENIDLSIEDLNISITGVELIEDRTVIDSDIFCNDMSFKKEILASPMADLNASNVNKLLNSVIPYNCPRIAA